jgi:hypothetical protein
MATPSATIGEMLTVTMYKRSKKMGDGISRNIPLLRFMRDNQKLISGGESILEEQLFAENAAYQRYSGAEVLNTSQTEQFTSFRFLWKQVACAVVINGLESDVQNTGPEQMFDLLEKRIEAAEYTMMNQMAVDIESDGTADGGKQIGGLGLLVPATPTSGTVGGIDRATYTWARSQLLDASDNGITLSNSTIQAFFGLCVDALTRNAERPTLVYAGGTHFRWYRESLQTVQRIMKQGDPKVDTVGGGDLDFLGIPVINGGGYSGIANANITRFLNLNHLYFKTAAKRNFVPLKARDSFNQDATVRYLAWAGNMTGRNLFLNGYAQQ